MCMYLFGCSVDLDPQRYYILDVPMLLYSVWQWHKIAVIPAGMLTASLTAQSVIVTYFAVCNCLSLLQSV